ncbi:MAG: BCD family MFS transporter [Pseudomonadota bacterium]|nr:BCD family MFS transporter [Pseudomonadota bacterium]
MNKYQENLFSNLFAWLQIWTTVVRLGVVQMAIGSMAVLPTTTFNTVMVTELGLLQLVPGILIAIQYFVQITRPNWGFRSDIGGNRTLWIMIGLFILGMGLTLACLGIYFFPMYFYLGLTVSIIGYILIGLGVSAAGTTLLTLIATSVRDDRKGAAATITWTMMILGIVLTAGFVGEHIIDPYSIKKLFFIVLSLSFIWPLICGLSVYKIEKKTTPDNFSSAKDDTIKVSFTHGLKQVLSEKNTRRFFVFVFLSMMAFFMQEPILEPYSVLAFDFTIGESTDLTSEQNKGVLLGMLLVGVATSVLRIGSLKFWAMFGCVGSGLALLLIAFFGQVDASKMTLIFCVYFFGLNTGIFVIGAIGSMMKLANLGTEKRVGTRMGVFGVGQAIASGVAVIFSSLLVDIIQTILNDPAVSYGLVLSLEAILFLAAAVLAVKLLTEDKEFN